MAWLALFRLDTEACMVYNKSRGRAGVRKIGRGSDMGVNILFGLVFGVSKKYTFGVYYVN